MSKVALCPVYRCICYSGHDLNTGRFSLVFKWPELNKTHLVTWITNYLSRIQVVFLDVLALDQNTSTWIADKKRPGIRMFLVFWFPPFGIGSLLCMLMKFLYFGIYTFFLEHIFLFQEDKQKVYICF